MIRQHRVTAHGPFELTAIVVAGVAGMLDGLFGDFDFSESTKKKILGARQARKNLETLSWLAREILRERVVSPGICGRRRALPRCDA